MTQTTTQQEYATYCTWGRKSYLEAPHEREKGFAPECPHALIDGNVHLAIVVATSYYCEPDCHAEEARLMMQLGQSYVH